MPCRAASLSMTFCARIQCSRHDLQKRCAHGVTTQCDDVRAELNLLRYEGGKLSDPDTLTRVEALQEGRVASVQTLSGTGACRVIGEFYSRFLGKGAPIYLPTPTWGNHIPIMRDAGLDVRSYRYFDKATNGLDYEGMMEDLVAIPDGAAVTLRP